MSKPVYLQLQSESVQKHWQQVLPEASPIDAQTDPTKPGCVVLEVQADNGLDLDTKARIQQLARHGHRVLVTTLYPLPAQGVEVLRAGAHGYIHALAHPQRIHAALTALEQGQVWLNDEVLSALLTVLAPQHALEWPKDFTRREREIAEALMAGKSNAEIAEDLHIAESTVKTHIKHLFEKTGVHDRLGFVLKFRDAGHH